MLIRRRDGGVQVRAPAKVNLFLEVHRRRPDGYHDLATLMVTVGLYDTLDVRETPDGTVQLSCDHPGLSTGADNLVVRAAQLLRSRFNVKQGAAVRLEKRIPLAAGLAGGSSDAAATLAALDRLWGLGLSKGQLAQLGAEVGSDVAFFFHAPAAWCTGRGEIVEPSAVGRPLDLVLAGPSAGLSTASVFGALTVPETPADGAAARAALAAGDVSALGRALFNRLEEPAIGLYAEVGRLRQALSELGPAGVLMSGSGTTVFALTDGPAEAMRVARALQSGREAGCAARVHVVRSCD